MRERKIQRIADVTAQTMIHFPQSNSPRRLRWLLLPLAACCAAPGCRKPEIRTYIAPKEEVTESRPANTALEGEKPHLSYTAPPAWKDMGGDNMSAARFSIPGGPGEASVMITPLPLMAGQEASLVNMWRQMTEQPLLSPEEAAKALSGVEVAGDKGQLFEVSGKRAEGETKIVTAFIHRDDKSWFFKLQGDPAAVDAQRAAFIDFLKSVRFDAAAPTAAPAPAPPAAPQTPAPVSEVPGGTPEGWTVQTPGPMQAAKFTVPEKEGAKAEVMVSIFPGDTGGAAANVSRWRGQLGLPEIDAAALSALIKPLTGGPEGAIVVDLENAGRALTGAIVPRGGQWFFYKLTGDAAAVAAARESFINFCKAGS